MQKDAGAKPPAHDNQSAESVKPPSRKNSPSITLPKEGGAKPAPTEGTPKHVETTPVVASQAEVFKRLSPSSIAALEYAYGLSSQINHELQRNEAPKIHTEYLILGLYNKQNGPTQELFGSAGLDRAQLAELIHQATDTVVPDTVSPIHLTTLPPLSKHVQEALANAVKEADKNPTDKIHSRHLLYGALSVPGCSVVEKLLAFSPEIRPDRIDLTKYSPAPKATPPPAIPAAPSPSTRPPEEDSIEVSSITDTPAETDSLGFKPYVEAISSFLLSPDTKPPLTLSIEGEWGSGKSSLMLQLKNAVVGEPLRKRVEAAWQDVLPGRNDQSRFVLRIRRLWDALWDKRRFSVQFNPWRHDKEESLWAAFALEFLRQVSKQRFFPRSWWGSARLFYKHYRWKRGWLEALRAIVLWAFLLVLLVGVPVQVFLYKPRWAEELLKVLTEKNRPATPEANRPKYLELSYAADEKHEGSQEKEKNGEQQAFDPLLKTLLLIGGNAGYLAVVFTVWLKAKNLIGNPLQVDLEKYMRSPDYEGRVAFVEQFHEDFKNIVDAYAGKRKVFVFIDDLDRCEVPKAAELIKAVNLLIADDPRLIFILGMDRDKVAAGLAVKYEKMLPYIFRTAPSGPNDVVWKRRMGLEFGQEFLQKFIQLPFRVPDPNINNYLEFLQTISRAAKKPSSPPASVGASTVSVHAQPGTPEAPSSAAATPPAAPRPTASSSVNVKAAQKAEQREIELQVTGDSEKIREAAMMFAKTLGTNPRRMKQFINLFRLQAYIVNQFRLFNEGYGGTPAVTLEQLSKFVAISLRWPELLTDFEENPALLAQIQDLAANKPLKDFDEPSSVAKRWIAEKKVKDFFLHGMANKEAAYSLANPGLTQLLFVCRPRPRPRPEINATQATAEVASASA